MCVVLIVCEVDKPTCMQIEEKNREDSIFYSTESVHNTYNKQLRELRAVCIVLEVLSLIKQFQRRGKLLYGTGKHEEG